jgi:hypothetical protein
MTNSGVIKKMEEELRNCFAKAEEECLHPSTRHLGKLRIEMVQQCQKFLELVKHREG